MKKKKEKGRIREEKNQEIVNDTLRFQLLYDPYAVNRRRTEAIILPNVISLRWSFAILRFLDELNSGNK